MTALTCREAAVLETFVYVAELIEDNHNSLTNALNDGTFESVGS